MLKFPKDAKRGCAFVQRVHCQIFQTFSKHFSQYRETNIFLLFNKRCSCGELLNLSKRFVRFLRKRFKDDTQKMFFLIPKHKRFSSV